jgi:sialidase-1
MKDPLLLLLLITTAQWRVGSAASVDVFHRLQVDSANTSYFCFRIPALVRARSGALVAFSEGRRTSCADAGDVR